MTDRALRRRKRDGDDRRDTETPGGPRRPELDARADFDVRAGRGHPFEPDDVPGATVAASLDPARPSRGKHVSRPRDGRHVRGEMATARAADEPRASYAARHAVADWVDLSATAS